MESILVDQLTMLSFKMPIAEEEDKEIVSKSIPIHLRNGDDFWKEIQASSPSSSSSSSAINSFPCSRRWSSQSVPPSVYSLPCISLKESDKLKLAASNVVIDQQEIFRTKLSSKISLITENIN